MITGIRLRNEGRPGVLCVNHDTGLTYTVQVGSDNVLRLKISHLAGQKENDVLLTGQEAFDMLQGLHQFRLFSLAVQIEEGQAQKIFSLEDFREYAENKELELGGHDDDELRRILDEKD